MVSASDNTIVPHIAGVETVPATPLACGHHGLLCYVSDSHGVVISHALSGSAPTCVIAKVPQWVTLNTKWICQKAAVTLSVLAQPTTFLTMCRRPCIDATVTLDADVHELLHSDLETVALVYGE